MRRSHTFGATALLLLFALAGSASPARTPHLIAAKSLTLDALTTVARPPVSNVSGDDYLPYVCHQGEYQWEPDKLPVKVWISDGAGVPGYRPEFNGYVRQAFDKWVQASCGKLAWKEVSNAHDADVTVNWTAQVTQRANGTEAGETNAYTRLDQSTGRGIIYGARMSILTELPGKPFTDDFMDKTILHETGHALGLQGHSPDPTDIMYYAINDQQIPQLTGRDEATMAHLYDGFPGTAQAVVAQTSRSANQPNAAAYNYGATGQ